MHALTHMQAPTKTDIDRELERYREGITLLRSVCADLTEEQLRERPIEGRWSMLECVCHIADFEPILAYRMKSMLAFDLPELVGIDETEYGKALHYQKRNAENELAVFESTRRQMLSIFKELSPDQFVRKGRHTELGRISVWTYLLASSGHVEHHMHFMNEKRVAFGFTSVPCRASTGYPAKGDA